MGIKVTRQAGRFVARCACGHVSKGSLTAGPAQVRASLHLATVHHIKPAPITARTPADQLALGI